MCNSLADLLNLPLAWKRIKLDAPRRAFVRNPYELYLVESDLTAWLHEAEELLRRESYHPSSMTVIDVPKGNGLVRPAGCLSLIDRLIYYALLGACYPHIRRRLATYQNVVDYSYPLAPYRDLVKWIANYFPGEQAFQRDSQQLLEQGFTFVVFTDITSYYENIDLHILISDLNAIGCPQSATQLLRHCLYKWSTVTGRGIPQGFSPSDILGKLYLHNIDRSLRAASIEHKRYVDDIRIFCRSYSDAKKSLLFLSRQLRKRGLHIQAAKTRILHASDAKEEIDRIDRALRAVRSNYIKATSKFLNLDSPYPQLWDADDLVEKTMDKTSISIIRKAYKLHFIREHSGKFDKRLFNFLLARLGNVKDSFAFPHVLSLLTDHPEITDSVLRYLSNCNIIDKAQEHFVDFLSSENAIYEYQKYQIIEAIGLHSNSVSESMLATVKMILNKAKGRYLRAACRHLIGKFGDPADLDEIEESYSDAADEFERAEIICALARMEPGRRNSFLGRVQNEHTWTQRAARLVRQGRFDNSVAQPKSV